MTNQKVQQAKHYWIHFVISITMEFHKKKNFIPRFNHLNCIDPSWPQLKLQIRNRNDGYCVPISPGQWEKINCGLATCLADTCDANFMTSQENIFLAFGDTEIKARDLRYQLKSSDGSFTSSTSITLSVNPWSKLSVSKPMIIKIDGAFGVTIIKMEYGMGMKSL